jgi:8-amino-7-oxononanoate synthase
MAEIEELLKKRQADGLLRVLQPVSGRRKGRIFRDHKEYIDFSSNDYLGLSSHPELVEAAKKALDEFGSGSCASRLMSGDLELHHRLEEAVAEFKNKEAALVFNSGYQANAGMIGSLYGKGDCIFSDRLNHASIVDGILLSRARFFRFRHNDTGHLESLLKKERKKFAKALVITESVFSMDGDRAPLKELAALKEKYNCAFFVDEAHATGIFGREGAGLVQEEGLEEEVDFIMGTFSKALAGFGAYLVASRSTINYLVNTCRSFIYSTALPASVIAGDLKSIELVKREPLRRQSLLASALHFRSALKDKGFQVRGDSQIVPLIIGDNLRSVESAERLKEKGYWALPIRLPTVPANEARLRFSITYDHDKKILEKLIDDICSIGI